MKKCNFFLLYIFLSSPSLLAPTTEEINPSYYTVEYSTNGEVFTVQGNVAATGLPTNNNSFVHMSAGKGIGFYRIISMEKDGKTYYNGIRKIAPVANNGGFALLANPVVKVVLQVQFNNTADIKIANTAGQVLHQQKVSSGINPINVNGFLNGIYLLLAKGQTKKFVVE